MSSPALARLARFGINAPHIGASTAAMVDLLRQHWISADCFAVAWLLAIQAQRLVPEPRTSQTARKHSQQPSPEALTRSAHSVWNA